MIEGIGEGRSGTRGALPIASFPKGRGPKGAGKAWPKPNMSTGLNIAPCPLEYKGPASIAAASGNSPDFSQSGVFDPPNSLTNKIFYKSSMLDPSL
jgi:hypothetical protein